MIEIENDKLQTNIYPSTTRPIIIYSMGVDGDDRRSDSNNNMGNSKMVDYSVEIVRRGR